MSLQHQEWQVDRIIQRANDKGIIKYKVLWKGFPPQEATWEPIEHLEHCKEAIFDFENSLKKLQNLKGSKQKDTQPVGLHDAGSGEENSAQSKLKQHEERISNDQEEELRVPSENDKEQPEKEEEALVEPQTENAEEPAKEVIVKQEAECAGKPETHPEDEALNSKKREFEPSESEDPQAGKPGKKMKKVDFELKEEFVNPTTIEANNPPKVNTVDQSRKRNQSVDPKPFKKPEKATKNPSDPKNSETKSSQEKKDRIFRRHSSRYTFCDKEFLAQQKNILSNLMRKIAGQEKVKSKSLFIDISKTSDLLEVFDGLVQVNTLVPLSTLDLLVRVDQGWAAIGRSEGRYIIADVNLIDEQSWSVFVNWLKKKERNE